MDRLGYAMRMRLSIATARMAAWSVVDAIAMRHRQQTCAPGIVASMMHSGWSAMQRIESRRRRSGSWRPTADRTLLSGSFVMDVGGLVDEFPAPPTAIHFSARPRRSVDKEPESLSDPIRWIVLRWVAGSRRSAYAAGWCGWDRSHVARRRLMPSLMVRSPTRRIDRPRSSGRCSNIGRLRRADAQLEERVALRRV